MRKAGGYLDSCVGGGREGGEGGGEVREVLLALQPSQGNVNRKTVSSSFT